MEAISIFILVAAIGLPVIAFILGIIYACIEPGGGFNADMSKDICRIQSWYDSPPIQPTNQYNYNDKHLRTEDSHFMEHVIEAEVLHKIWS